MKKFFISLIRLYQKIPISTHFQCRYTPTCSEYMIIAIERFGVIKGGILGIKRIMRCNPWGGSGIDLVPLKEEKK